MNLVIFGYYRFEDGYYAYGKYFQKTFSTVSFFPLIEFRDKMNLKQTEITDIDNIIFGNFNKTIYTDYLINHNVPKDVVIIAHNNDMIDGLTFDNIKLIEYIQNLKKIKDFQLIQINWDPMITNHHPSPYFDISFCADPFSLKNYSNTQFFPQGYSPDTTYYCQDDNYSCDVSFIGTNLYTDPMFTNQSLNRKQVLDAIYSDKSISLHVYGPEFLKNHYPESYKGFIRYEDCYKVFSNSKFSLNISPLNDIQYNNYYYYSERLPQIIACNGVMISNNDFTPFLLPGIHYIYINNINELVPTIKEYLSNPIKIELIKEEIESIKDKFNYEHIIPQISKQIIQKSFKTSFFLLDHSYTISHLLIKLIENPINLIYITYNNDTNHYFNIIRQELMLKHINKIGFNYNIQYVHINELLKVLKENHIFLNLPISTNINIDLEKDKNEINIYDIIDNKYSIELNKINIAKDIGHGIDEESLICLFINNNCTISSEVLTYAESNRYTKVKNITNLEKKLELFKNIYKIDSSKKTIIFFDNYLYPFLTNKDPNHDKFAYDVTETILNQLIQLKKDYNVVLRFHPFNELGIRLGKEFSNKLMNNFILDFTPFELSVLHDFADYIISNRYTSTGIESIFSKCENIVFIDYDFDKRKLPDNYINVMTNDKFDIILKSGLIVNNSMIPIINDNEINLIDIITNNKFYKNTKPYFDLYYNQ